jgi:uroporphyrinogen III methyltransferase / synthase
MRRAVVVVTREGSPDDPLGMALAGMGAEVVWLPTTATKPPLDLAPLDVAASSLASFDWLVFTSRHAVEALCARPAFAPAWRAAGEKRPRVAAVGERTAALLSARGMTPDLVPPDATGSALAAALVDVADPIDGRRVLWPRSDIARRELPDALARAGATVVEPVAYRTVAVAPPGFEAFRARLEAGRVDAVCFLAPSAAESLAAAFRPRDLAALKSRCLVASLGPTTTRALESLGAPPDVEPTRRSAAGLVEALRSRLALLEGASR